MVARHPVKVKVRVFTNNSSTHRKNGHSKGKKNSQYGTCWIFNEELKENKKIKKEDLDKWINKGWVKGRKIKI